MKETLFKEKYPIYTITISKKETRFTSVDGIIEMIKRSILEHPVASYIGIFDHFSHTQSLSDGEIAPEMSDAKNIIFCFGKELTEPMILAVRPRSIGVADMGESFTLSFLEAPNPTANEAMSAWIKSLLN
ncbi:MAG: hypothetical protein U9N52_11455 [Campylobacterota bacterium]|nr:hypothetical protein [Campylobacterota bacterium]